MDERFNDTDTRVYKAILFERELHIVQDPTSGDLGLSIWDASVVLAKYVEHNKNRMSKFVGRKVLELGAGIGGLCGIAFALLGASEVYLSDLPQVSN